MALHGSIAFLHLLLLTFTEKNVAANPLNYNTKLSVVGYYGPVNLQDMVIGNANASWFDAFNECYSSGYDIAKASSSGQKFLHLRDYLFRKHQEFIGVPLWTGFLKPNLDGVWYQRDKCDKTVSETTSRTFLNSTVGERQCLLMNMSVNAAQIEYSWYATSCYEQHPFICERKLRDRLLVAYEGMQLQHVDTDTSVTHYSNMALEDCVDELKNAAKVFIVEYNSSSETCTLYKRSVLDLPFEVNLTVISEDNSTISYLKSEENRVTVFPLPNAVFNRTYQNTDLPCYGYNEPTETTIAPTTTAAVLLMTTTATLDISSSLDQWIVWTKEENTVDETTLSSYRNKRVSAYDSRSSSTAIGVFGAIFIATVILLVVLSDLPMIVRDLRHNIHQWKPHKTEDKLMSPLS